MKTFEVDWNNYEEVNKLFQQLKSRKLELEPNRVSNKVKQGLILRACFEVLETDISHLYTKSLNDSTNYYVYVHCDPTNKLMVTRSGTAAFAAALGMKSYPFYIGKGKDSRAFDLNRNETHRKVRQKIKSFYKDVEVVIIQQNLTSNQALALESKLIDIFALLSKGGKLCNLDEGKEAEERRLHYMDKLKIINKFYHGF